MEKEAKRKKKHLFMAISIFLKEHNMNLAVLIKMHMLQFFWQDFCLFSSQITVFQISLPRKEAFAEHLPTN